MIVGLAAGFAACLVAAVASLLRGGKDVRADEATSPAGAPMGLEPVEELG
jgi:chromosome condensin MukBEF MukE localization factor